MSDFDLGTAAAVQDDDVHWERIISNFFKQTVFLSF